MTGAPYTLVLLRHGESEWNAKNLFTGWVDVPLTDKGRDEAERGGHLLVEAGVLPDVLHTSVLRRAITTAQLALDACERHWIPVQRHWRLNERHYGALQGKDKKQTKEEFGEEQFMLWRRSYDTPPPRIDDDDKCSQIGDARYADLPDEIVPRTECLKDVVLRMLPYWYDAIVPDLRAGRTVCVAAHGNSLRALVKHLDDMSEEAVVGLNIPTGIPLVYELDERMRPVQRGGRYLDADAAAAAIEAVANQGALMELDVLNGDMAGPFVRHLGLEFTSTSGDRVEARWTAGEKHHQPYGIVHGGVHASVVETLASVGAAAWFGDRGQCVGVSNSTDFFRAVRDGEMTSVATPVHQGRSQQVWVVETRDAEGRLVARGQLRVQNITR